MIGHRQAAVALYSLAASDQERILAELPARDQRILQDYLAELAALGFDKAANTAEAVAPRPFAPVAAPSDPHTLLHGALAADVLALVANEPASLIAQLLALDSWPWADALLELLPPAKRKLVGAALHAGVEPAPVRARCLITAIGANLRHTSAEPVVARGRRVPVALRKWLPWNR